MTTSAQPNNENRVTIKTVAVSLLVLTTIAMMIIAIGSRLLRKLFL